MMCAWSRAQLLGKLPAHRVTFMVALRAQLRSGPMYIVFPGLVATLCVFSYSIWTIERAYRAAGIDSNIATPTRAVWFVVATLTTVGYGDVYPSKGTGYTTAMLEGLVAMVLTSLLVAVVIERLRVKGSELRMYNWIQSEVRTVSRRASGYKFPVGSLIPVLCGALGTRACPTAHGA